MAQTLRPSGVVPAKDGRVLIALVVALGGLAQPLNDVELESLQFHLNGAHPEQQMLKHEVSLTEFSYWWPRGGIVLKHRETASHGFIRL